MKIEMNLMVLGRAAIVLGGMNNGTRVQILEELGAQEGMTFMEILKALNGVSMSALANHLAKLKKAGLVKKRLNPKSNDKRVGGIYYLNGDKLAVAYRCINVLAAMPPDKLPDSGRRRA